jgi:energy-coupling factor transporter ATP-binding protein EcfA2
MKLVKMQIANFRSVEQSDPFSLEQVTCLVGKNEAGKSAVLLALAALNPHPSTPVTMDKERDYPRRLLTRYKELHPVEEAVTVHTVWELSKDEQAAVTKDLGEAVLKSPLVEVWRRYQGTGPEWKIELDLQKAVDHALAGAFDEAQVAALREATDAPDLVEKLSSLPVETDEQKKLLDRLREYKTFHDRAVALLTLQLPYLMYFSNYDRMEGAVHIESLKTLKEGDIAREEQSGKKLFMEFLDYAGVPLDDILNVKTYETFNAKLQAASNSITDQILEYWTQNSDLSVEVDIRPAHPGDPAPFNTGTVGRARIYNSLHRVDTLFSERSVGFVWFFSFLVKFAQVKAAGKPTILLLDEPGLSLHGKAQGDLVRYFDQKLAPHHQIIYTTHSPFMVGPDKLASARIVEDVVEQRAGRRVSIGTKVREDIVSTDPDTLFPLQGALGYEITQTLFTDKHSLLVEGTSDVLYLQALSYALKSRRRAGLDSRWTICPTGGIGNVRAFVSLFGGGNKLDVAVLADQTKKDLKKIEELRRSAILKTGRVWTISDFTGKSESDVEDLFEPELYVHVINSAYRLPAAFALTAQSLEDADKNTVRLVKKAEAAFRTMPEPMPTYDHLTPAAWLVNNLTQLDKDSQAVVGTLQRAERLFVALNAALQ